MFISITDKVTAKYFYKHLVILAQCLLTLSKHEQLLLQRFLPSRQTKSKIKKKKQKKNVNLRNKITIYSSYSFKVGYDWQNSLCCTCTEFTGMMSKQTHSESKIL